ncbi:MAG: hypothetical protein D3926_12305 [Desulfobacteraceae bacterium]|nr:MAG: hypothetical protein D3926_12305 [Desulfobacteraceae bacterium]
MLPALQPDDLLVVSRNGLQRLHPGDVALFERNKGKLIAHRVLETDMSNGNVLTRGDARLFKDRRWTESDYFGRVTALFRQGKRLPVKASPGKLQWFTLVSRFWAKRMINLIRRYLKP